MQTGAGLAQQSNSTKPACVGAATASLAVSTRKKFLLFVALAGGAASTCATLFAQRHVHSALSLSAGARTACFTACSKRE